MLVQYIAFAYGAALAVGSPVPDPDPQLSLPPLIPSIPIITDPIVSNAPPLPILQVPTPPLASPPFTGSDIQPKKIGYFWTGAGDNEHAGKKQCEIKSANTANSSRLLGHLQPWWWYFRDVPVAYWCSYQRKLTSPSRCQCRGHNFGWRWLAFPSEDSGMFKEDLICLIFLTHEFNRTLPIISMSRTPIDPPSLRATVQYCLPSLMRSEPSQTGELTKTSALRRWWETY